MRLHGKDRNPWGLLTEVSPVKSILEPENASRTCKTPEGEEQQNQEPPDADDDGAQGLNEAVFQRLEGAREVLNLRGHAGHQYSASNPAHDLLLQAHFVMRRAGVTSEQASITGGPSASFHPPCKSCLHPPCKSCLRRDTAECSHGWH